MDRSPYSRLPQELRDHIYQYVLVIPEGVQVDLAPLSWTKQPWRSRSHGSNVPYLVKGEAAKHKHLLALTRTCKEIHSQIGGMFYKKNRFILSRHARRDEDYWKAFCRAICAWTDLLAPDNHTSLKQVAVDLGDWDNQELECWQYLIQCLEWIKYSVVEITGVQPELPVGLMPKTTIHDEWHGELVLDFGNSSSTERRVTAKAKIEGYIKVVQSHDDSESDRYQDCLRDLQELQRTTNEVLDRFEDLNTLYREGPHLLPQCQSYNERWQHPLGKLGR